MRARAAPQRPARRRRVRGRPCPDAYPPRRARPRETEDDRMTRTPRQATRTANIDRERPPLPGVHRAVRDSGFTIPYIPDGDLRPARLTVCRAATGEGAAL